MIGEEYKELLKRLIEAVRAIAPRREPFVCVEGRDGTVHLFHDGLGRAGHAAYPADLDTLSELGAIRVRGATGPDSLEVTPRGHALYTSWQDDPADAIVDAERRYIDSATFRSGHPAAFQRWQKAAELLWATDSAEHATSIGHLCREAHQLFVTSILEGAHFTPDEKDVQKTKNRLREVLAERIRSDRVRAVAEAAYTYFGAVADLAQRQEHAANREKELLTWEDSRRIVLHTLVIMTELARLLAPSP